MQAQLTALLDDGPWRDVAAPARAAPICCAPIGWTGAERMLLEAVARAILHGDRGDLRAQLDRPYPDSALPLTGSWRRRPGTRAVSSSPPVGVDEPCPCRPGADQRHRRLRRRGRAYASCSTAIRKRRAVGERHRQPALRHHRHGVGILAYLVREQPRESADAVRERSVTDPTAEALFIRDDESGEVWSPTPGPVPRDRAGGRIVVRHSAGVTHFTRNHRGIAPSRGVRRRVRGREVLGADGGQRKPGG